jgi:ADP-heptose:LPS heptosyltransferase
MARPTNLPVLAALMRQAHFCVGSDGDWLQIAAAVGLPCIGLYGPTRPQDSGAYGQPHIAVQAFYQSGQRHTRQTSSTAMNAIGADRVIEACESMIERFSITADRQAA